VPPLRVFATAMNRTTHIHRSPIHRKWVKALELVEEELHRHIQARKSEKINLKFPKSQGIDETELFRETDLSSLRKISPRMISTSSLFRSFSNDLLLVRGTMFCTEIFRGADH
jgi:hypothetical protein